MLKFAIFTTLALLLFGCSPSLENINAPDSLPQIESSSPIPTEALPVVTTTSAQIPVPGSIIPTNSPYRLLPGELELAASPGDIPAIFANDALFVSAEAGDAEWRDEESVIGVFLNGEARAYPIRLLSLHEIVNDNLGGRPIAITWCPLCYTALVFDRVIEGQELTFGASGWLFHNNLVMYDHQSETLWSQLLAQGIRGAYSRTSLKLIGASQSTWAAWKSVHPDTRILSAIQMGKVSDEIIDPYSGYYTSGAAGLGGQASMDERLPPKEVVLALQVDREKRAYTFNDIKEFGVINDHLGSLPVLVLYNSALNSASAFSRTFEQFTLSFEFNDAGKLTDQQSQSIWDIEQAIAISGPLEGERLSRLTGPLVFWFAWSDIFPETSVYLRDD